VLPSSTAALGAASGNADATPDDDQLHAVPASGPARILNSMQAPHPQKPQLPRAAPILSNGPKASRKGAATPQQTSACVRIPKTANSTEVCSMAAVTIPGCMYSCWNAARTAERCACCWHGQRLVDNSCRACPVGTYARSGWNVCQQCSPGYSTYSEASIACNGEAWL
jgi:hypothetical protein